MLSQAVILAGGLGTRLKPYTDENPKPMYPICGKPYIGYLIEQLRDACKFRTNGVAVPLQRSGYTVLNSVFFVKMTNA